MSSIVGGGGNLFIAAGGFNDWIVSWDSGGWQGNTVIEPQPLDPEATLTFSLNSVTMGPEGNYSFDVTVSNISNTDTLYNLQISSN